MNKNQLTNKISNFRDAVAGFKQLLLNSRDTMMPEIISNHEKISADRRVLIREYASLEKYLDKLGKKPRRRDGVNPEYYPVYLNAFSTDTLLRVGPSLEAVEQDLDYVLGKLEGMSEEEAINSVKDSPVGPKTIAFAGGGSEKSESVTIGIPPEKISIKHVKNPHKQYWGKLLHDIWAWTREHVLATIIGGLILAFLIYLLGWNK